MKDIEVAATRKGREKENSRPMIFFEDEEEYEEESWRTFFPSSPSREQKQISALLPRFPHFPLVDSINLSSKFNEHIAEWSPPGARFEFSYNCRPITGQEPREIVPPSFNFWYSPAIHPQLIRL